MTVPFTEPSAFMNMICTAPRKNPLALSKEAPAATSGTPSLSRSPMLATDMPNRSMSDSAGPFAVSSFISMVPFTEPSEFMNMMCTAPRSVPPASSPQAPAAMSGTPSPSRSPIPATDMPKRSSFDRVGPFAVSSFIAMASFTEPSAFMNIICMAPWLFPPASSPMAPAATSGIPSPSRSPISATDEPKKSSSDSAGPLSVSSFISTVELG